MDETILKIVPSCEELQIVGHRNQGSCKCSEVGCSYEAMNACILGLHRSQVHKFDFEIKCGSSRSVSCEDRTFHFCGIFNQQTGTISVHTFNQLLIGTDHLWECQAYDVRTRHKKGIENVHYHCPVTECYFNPQSERYFKNIDTLRTHYMKIHSEKKFLCIKCNKTFGLERDCHRHEAECGQNFYCVDCGKVYTNMSALRRHCDYNGHHSLAQKTKAKTLKESRSKPMKVLNKVKEKPPTVIKNAPPFILPKATSSQMHSLHIQTDASGSQFFISKMASDSSTSQGVQTVDRVSKTRSAGIQTNFEILPFYRSNVMSSQIERLSTGIQTVLPDFTNLNSLRVAQTQTKNSILQKAMTRASIPVLNICQGVKKSSCGQKRKRKANVSCTTGSQTFCPSTVVQRNHDICQDSSQLFLRDMSASDREGHSGLNGSMDFLMSTMSTQTSLSCVSGQIFSKFYNVEPGIQLQDCHTQTLGDVNNYGQSDSVSLDQNILPRSFAHNSDQITQTKSHNFSIDQDTQTGRANSCSSNEQYSFLSIQDNQTQTVHDPVSPDFSQMQTPIIDATNTAQSQDQGTICEELLSLSDRELPDFSKGDLSLDNDSGIYFLLGDKNESPEKCLRTMGSNNDLTDLLMEVINNDISCVDVCSSTVDDFKNPEQSTSMEGDLYGNCEKAGLPVASMETQTFGNWGMDSMTQTIEDLGWDMSTQTVDYLLTDMMTQTGDDFLEFMTNDTHTQTLNDFCMNLASDECLKTCSCAKTSTLDNEKEASLRGLFGDHVSTQTIWDSENQTLDLQSSSFAASVDTSFIDHTQQSGVKPGLYLEKEHSISRDLISYRETSVSYVSGKWESAVPSEAQISSDFGRDTETTETQTMHDPLFNCLTSEDTLSFNCGRKVKYLESSHTQTTQDPMLPSVVSDDDPGPFLTPQSLFAQKETSETQTGTEDHFPAGRETAECQTPWDNYFTSMETQTLNADFF